MPLSPSELAELDRLGADNQFDPKRAYGDQAAWREVQLRDRLCLYAISRSPPRCDLL